MHNREWDRKASRYATVMIDVSTMTSNTQASALLRKLEKTVQHYDHTGGTTRRGKAARITDRLRHALEAQDFVSIIKLLSEGMVFERRKLPLLAERCYEEALNICEMNLGAEFCLRIYPVTVRALERICRHLGKFAEAEMHKERLQNWQPHQQRRSLISAGSAGFFTLLGL